jgi:TolA-binding protein
MRFDVDDTEGAPGLPEWLSWVQLGLTTMLVVLFGVLLVRGREQTRLLQVLEQRVQGLEARGSLAGSSVMEQQLRTLMQRIQDLEGQREQLDALGARQQQLEADLLELRNRGGSLPSVAAPPPPAAESPRPDPGTPFRSPPRRQGTGVIRPPAQESF